MTDTTEREYLPHEWMTFVDAVRHVATANDFNDDPIDYIARGLDELREALIEGKIPIEWAGEISHKRGFNPYILYSLDEPRSHLEWAISYIAGETTIPDPRPSVISMNYIVDLRRLQHMRLLKTSVFELWPNGCAVQFDSYKQIASTQATKLLISEEQLKARLRKYITAMYEVSQPNMRIAEQQVLKFIRANPELRKASREFVRKILREDEFRSRRRRAGNSRGIKI